MLVPYNCSTLVGILSAKKKTILNATGLKADAHYHLGFYGPAAGQNGCRNSTVASCIYQESPGGYRHSPWSSFLFLRVVYRGIPDSSGAPGLLAGLFFVVVFNLSTRSLSPPLKSRIFSSFFSACKTVR